MDLELDGRVGLVTGASAGIGVGVATVLAGEGMALALVARRGEALERVAGEIEQACGTRPRCYAGDVTDRAFLEDMVPRVAAEVGPVEVLVNNAGGSRPMDLDAPEEEWEGAFALNMHALRWLTALCLPAMMERGWGRVVNMTGTGSVEPPGINAAAAAKAAVHVWSKGLSRTVGRTGVTVNCVSPGRIWSEQILQRLHPSEEERARYADTEIPLGYFGDPVDIGYTVAFLASRRARYITGETLYVDGGMHRAAF